MTFQERLDQIIPPEGPPIRGRVIAEVLGITSASVRNMAGLRLPSAIKLSKTLHLFPEAETRLALRRLAEGGEM